MVANIFVFFNQWEFHRRGCGKFCFQKLAIDSNVLVFYRDIGRNFKGKPWNEWE